MSMYIPMGPPPPKDPRQELEEAWLARYQSDHKSSPVGKTKKWFRRAVSAPSRETSSSLGDITVRQYYEAVRDELRGMGCVATVDPAIGAVYVIDAQQEKPGYVVLSVSNGKWSGYLQDARQINLQGTGIRPGAGASYSAIKAQAPHGFWDNLVSGRDHGRMLDAWAGVYGPGGTGMELLDYPDKMYESLKLDLDGVDLYNPHAVADRIMRAMRAKQITFSGTSNFAEGRFGDQQPEPVAVTPDLMEQWRTLGREGGTWRQAQIGGTSYTMPAPQKAAAVTTPG
jgi:hypothetical protein